MQDTNKSIFEFGLDDTGKSHLKSIAQFAGITAIIGFASLLLTIVSLVMVSSSRYSSAGSNIPSTFISVAINLIMNILLLNASNKIKKAISGLDQSSLTQGLSNLKTYFKVYGILLIIVIVLVLLIVLVGIIAGAGRGY
jgi:hypothetical protein